MSMARISNVSSFVAVSGSWLPEFGGNEKGVWLILLFRSVVLLR